MSLSVNFHDAAQVRATNLETSFAINITGENGYEGVTLYFEDLVHAVAFASAIQYAVKHPGEKFFPQSNGEVSGEPR